MSTVPLKIFTIVLILNAPYEKYAEGFATCVWCFQQVLKLLADGI